MIILAAAIASTAANGMIAIPAPIKTIMTARPEPPCMPAIARNVRMPAPKLKTMISITAYRTAAPGLIFLSSGDVRVDTANETAERIKEPARIPPSSLSDG